MTYSQNSAKLLEILNKNDMVAAPMAGISTPPFREILRKFFDGIIYSEMVSVEGLMRRIQKTLAYLYTTDKDNPLGLQIFGSKPESFQEAVNVLLDCCNPEIIDINMGCPVKKVLKSGSGCALLKDLKNIEQIIRATRKATEKILTIKIRLGWSLDDLVYKEVLKIAENEGVDGLTVHGRVKSEMFSGDIHYDMIGELKSIANIPIVGNGNVVDRESYDRMKETGVDGIMIGRAMMKQPWVFQAIKENKDPDNYFDIAQLKSLLFDIIEIEKHYRGELYFMDIVKKYAVWFSKGLKDSSVFRKEIYKAITEKQLVDLVERFFI